MALPNTTTVVQELPAELRTAFAPLVKNALGLAVGVIFAAFLSGLALHWMVRDPAAALSVWLLGDNFLPGYAPSVPGALFGGLWGLLIGFAVGWSLAVCRNLFISVWVALVAARERLRANREFLDEI